MGEIMNSYRMYLCITLLMFFGACQELNLDSSVKNQKAPERSLASAGSIWSVNEYRNIDGSHNNQFFPEWGKTGVQLRRLTSVAYEDGISEPVGNRPNPREISNIVLDQDHDILNNRELSHFVFQWGQFIDHDMDLTEEAIPNEGFAVTVPYGDDFLSPFIPIPLLRSRFDQSTGTGTNNPRQQINQITAFIDASNVYGSDIVRANELREFQGGMLKSSDGKKNIYDGNFLPFNVNGLYNAAPPPLEAEEYFLAGDIRVNEQSGLTAMHTLFMREHNRLAKEMARKFFPGQNLRDPKIDEEIYQKTKAMVTAELQVITYYEFLPALLGTQNLPSYEGYKAGVNPNIPNEFSGALYRVGHTMLPLLLDRRDVNGQSLEGGPVPLANVFFRPGVILNDGVESFLMGLSRQLIQEIDARIHDSVRQMLFVPPVQFDLGAINIQRGRDHGLASYNQIRSELGLETKISFSDISSDQETVRRLKEAYDNDLSKIDLWLGGVSEDHLPGSSTGELVGKVVSEQFQRVRDGDRFYFENYLPQEMIYDLKNTRLSDIIRKNTKIKNIQKEVFRSLDTFSFRIPEGSVQQDVTLTCQPSSEGMSFVVYSSDQSLLSKKKIDQTKRIVLLGNDNDNTLTIDTCVAEYAGQLDIEVLGMGGQDQLKFHQSVEGNSVQYFDQFMKFNKGLQIFYGNVELISSLGT